MKHKNEWNRLLGMICCLTLVLFMVPTLRPWAVDGSAGGGLHGDETETGEGSAENAQERTERDEGAEETKAGGQNFVSGETEAGEETDHVPGEDAATKDGTELELEDGECADPGGIEAGIEDGIETGTVAEAQKVMAVSASSYAAGDSYTDSRGNVFSLCIVDGDITITGIMVSGQELVIPDTIDDAPVVAVDSGDNSCVVVNPEITIPSLYVNCSRIGVEAFSGLRIGELTVGEDVTEFSHYSGAGLEHHWQQFYDCEIDRVVYGAAAVSITSPNPMAQNTYYGPFYGTTVHDLEFSSGVTLIPEILFRDSYLQVDTLTIDVAQIGGYAFAGENISIGTLIFGENVQTFLEFSDSDSVVHYYDQFRKANIGKICLYPAELDLEHKYPKSSNCYLYGPFREAAVGTLEVGTGVTRIPEALLKDAVMDLAGYEVSAPEIGAFAFASENISFGTLTIAESVTTFVESYYSYASPHYWSQFQGCTIGSLVYQAESAVSSNDYRVWSSPVFYGPFHQAEIGTLEIGDGVEKIPDYFMKDAKITLEDLVLDAAEIGAMSFIGDDLVIKNLTIGKNVERFAISANSNTGGQYWRQFYGQSFETVRFEAVESEVAGLLSSASSYSGPFVNATIGTLSFGDEVGVVPRYCFQYALIHQEELYVNAATIGPSAFRSADISIGTLIIGPDVENFTPLVYGVSNYFRQFGDTTIGTLRYEAVGAVSANSCVAGPFEGAGIGEVEFGDDVEAIPNYLLYHATAQLEELTVNVPTIGFYSFSGSGLVIERLTIGEDVGSFPCNSSNYNRAFYESAIGCLYYQAASAKVTGTYQNSYGPFSGGAVLDRVVIGEDVVFLDTRLFRGNTIADCVVYPVTASAEYLSQTWNNAYLPSVSKLYVHYNSEFKPFFAENAANEDWLCKNYYELSYGETVYDEVSDEYLMEVIRHCPICGHEEVSTEELDDSYSLFISLPVEISLSFSADSKSYEGWGQVLVYGEIGNVYSAAKVVVDKEREEYGTARNGESVIDISPFLSTSFCEGEEAVFPAFNIMMNTDSVEKANVEGFYTDDLTVTVLGYAFLMSGPGEYRIPIPLKVVVY